MAGLNKSGLNLLSRQTPAFPPVDRALADPNGLLAVGGALNPEWLTTAYRHGIFPWFEDDDGPILWWCPDPRAVIYPERIRISRSLAKRLRNGSFSVSADTVFSEVIGGCAAARKTNPGAESGTWITDEMMAAYTELHELGFAHSIEVWQPTREGDGRELVGGLYGVSLGRMFFGESMFSRVPDASKIALCHLAKQLIDWNFSLIDCQISNPHLSSLGAVDLPRAEFIRRVEENAHLPTTQGPWRLDTVDSNRWHKQP